MTIIVLVRIGSTVHIGTTSTCKTCHLMTSTVYLMTRARIRGVNSYLTFYINWLNSYLTFFSPEYILICFLGHGSKLTFRHRKVTKASLLKKKCFFFAFFTSCNFLINIRRFSFKLKSLLQKTNRRTFTASHLQIFKNWRRYFSWECNRIQCFQTIQKVLLMVFSVKTLVLFNYSLWVKPFPLQRFENFLKHSSRSSFANIVALYVHTYLFKRSFQFFPFQSLLITFRDVSPEGFQISNTY